MSGPAIAGVFGAAAVWAWMRSRKSGGQGGQLVFLAGMTRAQTGQFFIQPPKGDFEPDPATGITRPDTSGGRNDPAPIRAMIRKAESGSKGYNAIVYLVDRSRYPAKPLTQMTVGQVLDWQDSIDKHQNSEAVGAYQIMEDTLRSLVAQGHASRNDMFNVRTQDKLCDALLNQAGMGRYFSGSWSLVQFGNRLAKTWAGLPVLTDQMGAKIRVKAGQSYYTELAGNKATVGINEFKTALGKAKA